MALLTGPPMLRVQSLFVAGPVSAVCPARPRFPEVSLAPAAQRSGLPSPAHDSCPPPPRPAVPQLPSVCPSVLTGRGYGLSFQADWQRVTRPDLKDKPPQVVDRTACSLPGRLRLRPASGPWPLNPDRPGLQQ